MYGCMALMTEKYEEAETFFEAATCAESKSVIAWTMLGKYYVKLKSSWSLTISDDCYIADLKRTSLRSVPTPWPRGKYFPVRPSHSVNKYITFTVSSSCFTEILRIHAMTAQAVKAMHRCRTGHGFESRTNLFFRRYFRNCLSCVFILGSWSSQYLY